MSIPKTKPEEAHAGPAIAALPEPTLEERLRLMTFERDSLTETALKRAKELKDRDERIEDLLARISSLEKNPIFFALNNIDEGAPLDEAGAEMNILCADVKRLTGAGTLEIKIGVKLLKGSVETLVMTTKVKRTSPKAEPIMGIFFTDDEGSLTREDPKQLEMRFARREGK